MEYKLITAAVLDREALAVHRVNIECRDSGRPPLVASRTVEVRVEDENDNAPTLPLDVFFVAVVENSRPGVIVTTINATDGDDGPNGLLSYSLEPLDSLLSGTPGGGSAVGLTIDAKSGTIATDARFDYETKQTFTYLLTVSDAGEAVQRSAVATVVLDVVDVNDELPHFDRSFYSFHVAENRPAGTPVGRVRATDADRSPEHSRIFYFIDGVGGGGGVAFRIGSQTGELFTRSALDRESTAVWKFRIRASNDPTLGPKSAFAVADVTVYVDDLNDNTPIVVEPSSVNRTFFVRARSPTRAGYVIARVRAADADDGANARLTYSAVSVASVAGGTAVDAAAPRLFAVDETTGDVTSARNIDGRLDAGLYALAVAVRDAGSPRRLTTVAHLLINITTADVNDDDFDIDAEHSPNYFDDPDDDVETAAADRNGVVDVSSTTAATGSGLTLIAIGTIGALIVLLMLAVVCAMLCSQHQRHSGHSEAATASTGKQHHTTIDATTTAPVCRSTGGTGEMSAAVGHDRQPLQPSATVGVERDGGDSSKRAVTFCMRRQSTSSNDLSAALTTGTVSWLLFYYVFVLNLTMYIFSCVHCMIE